MLRILVTAIRSRDEILSRSKAAGNFGGLSVSKQPIGASQALTKGLLIYTFEEPLQQAWCVRDADRYQLARKNPGHAERLERTREVKVVSQA
jgi:hypothetical protein